MRRLIFGAIALALVAGLVGGFLTNMRDEPPLPTSPPATTNTTSPSAPGPSPGDRSSPTVEETSPAPAPVEPAEGATIWDGPDEAVSTFYSETCQREVLRFGAQAYRASGTVGSVPNHVSYLGYSHGERQLWGDRATPDPLYVTRNGGASFTEWMATSEDC